MGLLCVVGHSISLLIEDISTKSFGTIEDVQSYLFNKHYYIPDI
jgi:hypothetical protein